MVVWLVALGCGSGPTIEERVQAAEEHLRDGREALALTSLYAILDGEPDEPAANALLGEIHLARGDPSLAVWALTRAFESQALRLRIGLPLARVLFELAAPAAALDVLDRMPASARPDLERVHLRAELLLSLARPDRALAELEQAAAAVATAAPATVFAHADLRSRAFAKLGRPDRAREEWTPWLDASDVSRPGQGVAVATPSGTGLEWAGLACLRRAERLVFSAGSEAEAGERAYSVCEERFGADDRVVAAVAADAWRRNQTERALGLQAQLVARRPDDFTAAARLAGWLATSGRGKDARRRIREAAETFERGRMRRPGPASTRTRSPHFPAQVTRERQTFQTRSGDGPPAFDASGAWRFTGDFLRQLGDLAGARMAWQRALAMAPDSGDALRFALGDLAVEEDEIARARRWQAELTDPRLRALLAGSIAWREGEARRALDAFEVGLRGWPGNAGARALAGQAALALGEEDRALSHLREAVRAAPASTDAARTLARIHADRGEAAAALRFAHLHLVSRPWDGDPASYAIAIASATELGRREEAAQLRARLRALQSDSAGD